MVNPQSSVKHITKEVKQEVNLPYQTQLSQSQIVPQQSPQFSQPNTDQNSQINIPQVILQRGISSPPPRTLIPQRPAMPNLPFPSVQANTQPQNHQLSFGPADLEEVHRQLSSQMMKRDLSTTSLMSNTSARKEPIVIPIAVDPFNQLHQQTLIQKTNQASTQRITDEPFNSQQPIPVVAGHPIVITSQASRSNSPRPTNYSNIAPTSNQTTTNFINQAGANITNSQP